MRKRGARGERTPEERQPPDSYLGALGLWGFGGSFDLNHTVVAQHGMRIGGGERPLYS